MSRGTFFNMGVSDSQSPQPDDWIEEMEFAIETKDDGVHPVVKVSRVKIPPEAATTIREKLREARLEEMKKWRPMVRRLSEYVDSPDSLVEFDERIKELEQEV